MGATRFRPSRLSNARRPRQTKPAGRSWPIRPTTVPQSPAAAECVRHTVSRHFPCEHMSHLRKPPDVAGERALETTLDKRRGLKTASSACWRRQAGPEGPSSTGNPEILRAMTASLDGVRGLPGHLAWRRIIASRPRLWASPGSSPRSTPFLRKDRDGPAPGLVELFEAEREVINEESCAYPEVLREY